MSNFKCLECGKEFDSPTTYGGYGNAFCSQECLNKRLLREPLVD